MDEGLRPKRKLIGHNNSGSPEAGRRAQQQAFESHRVTNLFSDIRLGSCYKTHMNQSRRNWEEDTEESSSDDAPDPWFQPVWEDTDEPDDDTPPHARPLPARPNLAPARDRDDILLGPLAAASAALARLDAMAEIASTPVRDGLIARLAYAEAAGRLASQGITVHPVDLSLRDSERIGRRDLWVRHRVGRKPSGVPAWNAESVWLGVDDKITAALALARLLRQLPVADNPMVSAERAQAWLGPLATDAGGFDERRFAQWHDTHVPDGRRPSDRPALLRAADAAAAWMESGISDLPDATQALAVAALLIRRTGTLSAVPLPLWGGWTALCAPDEPGTLPRLRGDVATRLAPGGALWAAVFLHLAAEAARGGSRILAELRAAESAGLGFAAREDKRSRLPATVEMLVRQPALTAAALARRVEITPQAALRLFSRLEREGLVGEVTGRGSFRAFAIAVRSVVQSAA
jgi:hypothetical protein